MKAFVAIPPVAELYPWGAVCAGLRALGHDILPATQPLDGDFLITWSPWRRSRREAIMLHYQRDRRPVIVMENGWLSPIHGKAYFQMALDGWNGAGIFPAGYSERFHSWDVPLKPWQQGNDKSAWVALVAGQRGHPFDDRSSPIDWHKTVALADWPENRIVRRDRDSPVPLAKQLAVTAEAHVWTSNLASHAIIAGVPVVQHGPNLMVSNLASRPGQMLRCPDRAPELERLAWAQWSTEEIMGGYPLAMLLLYRERAA